MVGLAPDIHLAAPSAASTGVALDGLREVVFYDIQADLDPVSALKGPAMSRPILLGQARLARLEHQRSPKL